MAVCSKGLTLSDCLLLRIRALIKGDWPGFVAAYPLPIIEKPDPHKAPPVASLPPPHGFDVPDCSSSVPEPTVSAAIAMARQGQFSRAMRKFEDATVEPWSPEVAKKLQALHPPETPPPDWPNTVLELSGLDTKCPRITGLRAMELLREFDVGSSGGVYGLRPALLERLVGGNSGTEALNAMAKFLNLLAAGRIPPTARAFFFGARLIALGKKGGGVRPIASGDVFRRILGKFYAAAMKTELEAQSKCDVVWERARNRASTGGSSCGCSHRLRPRPTHEGCDDLDCYSSRRVCGVCVCCCDSYLASKESNGE